MSSTTTDSDPVSKHRPQRLVQSKLTSAFFSPKATGNVSPYFTIPPVEPASPSPTPEISTPPVDLHPSRRSNLIGSPLRLQTSSSSSSSTHRMLLAATAAETKSLLPRLLAFAPHAPASGQLIHRAAPLDPKFCPHYPRSAIRVLNADTLDAAIALSKEILPTTTTTTGVVASATVPRPVCILNMANANHAGGGWTRGALAQEESLCYRSSLSFSLKKRFYPIPDAGGIYSPSVLVLRESLASGHGLLDLAHPDDLPIVSVVSVAAITDPPLSKDGLGYQNLGDREEMKEKMRVVLRIAGRKGHRRLVLGALGCGAFGNPRAAVVGCWREVFGEVEFAGGWWEAVVFAVMEEGGVKDGDGNFGEFWRGLGGFVV